MLINERKFTTNSNAKDIALAYLKHVCINDPIFPYGIVTSIYFDTIDLKSYQEKINGDFLKSKLRLRWYDSSKNDENINVFIEFKNKIGSARDKSRFKINISKTNFSKIIKSNHTLTEFINNELQQNDISLPSNIFALIQISYKRNRFICPFTKANVCLDYDIQAKNIYLNHQCEINEAHFNSIVMEIKDSSIKHIPWLNKLVDLDFRNQNFSKFAQGLKYLQRYNCYETFI